MGGIEVLLLLVAIATSVAAFARRLRVPAPSLLVVVGVGIASIPGVPEMSLPPDLVGLIFLPPLLYAAGQDLPWRELRPVWRPVAALALGLVVATAAAVAVVATWIVGLPPSMGLVLGAVLASTDPVAVTALGRRLALPPRLRALIQAESLFNDATSLVLVRVATAAVVAGATMSAGRGVVQFLLMGTSGALIGAVVAATAWLIRRRIEDPVLETVLALLTPYAAYVLAEGAHVSGVTAVVVASVILAGQSSRIGRAPIRLQVHAVYDTAVFILESVIFGLIGLQLPALVRSIPGTDWTWIAQAAALAATLLAVRAVWVFPTWLVTRARDRAAGSWRVPAVVSWAGARGVLPLTAALSLPLVADSGATLPGRDRILLLTTAVIVVTLVVQGATLGALVRWSGIAISSGHAEDEQRAARTAMATAALTYLDRCETDPSIPPVAIDQLRDGLRLRLGSDGRSGHDVIPMQRRLRQDLIAVEAAELNRLYEVGEIGATTRHELQRRLDLEHASLDG